MMVCVFSLKSLTETYQYQDKKKKTPEIVPNTICLQLWDFWLGTQERVRNSRGK